MAEGMPRGLDSSKRPKRPPSLVQKVHAAGYYAAATGAQLGRMAVEAVDPTSKKAVRSVHKAHGELHSYAPQEAIMERKKKVQDGIAHSQRINKVGDARKDPQSARAEGHYAYLNAALNRNTLQLIENVEKINMRDVLHAGDVLAEKLYALEATNPALKTVYSMEGSPTSTGTIGEIVEELQETIGVVHHSLLAELERIHFASKQPVAESLRDVVRAITTFERWVSAIKAETHALTGALQRQQRLLWQQTQNVEGNAIPDDEISQRLHVLERFEMPDIKKRAQEHEELLRLFSKVDVALTDIQLRLALNQQAAHDLERTCEELKEAKAHLNRGHDRRARERAALRKARRVLGGGIARPKKRAA